MEIVFSLDGLGLLGFESAIRRDYPVMFGTLYIFTLLGLLVLSRAGSYPMLLAGAALVGTGSSVFHPESSRMARLASGGRYGLAQSMFQVGGNTGAALGPLLAAVVVLPHGQGSLAWFSVAALTAIVVLARVGIWYKRRSPAAGRRGSGAVLPAHTRQEVIAGITVLATLMFSKTLYSASLGTFYIFYLIHRFGISVQDAQIYLFIFFGASALGTLVGGPVGDRFGRRYVIWFSILGALPFAVALPHVGLFWTVALTIPIGLIMSSAFSAILVFAQELVPGRVGMVSGIFFGFSFGLGGLGAAALGELADFTSIDLVYEIAAWLPALGLLTWFLPDIERARLSARQSG